MLKNVQNQHVSSLRCDFDTADFLQNKPFNWLPSWFLKQNQGGPVAPVSRLMDPHTLQQNIKALWRKKHNLSSSTDVQSLFSSLAISTDPSVTKCFHRGSVFLVVCNICSLWSECHPQIWTPGSVRPHQVRNSCYDQGRPCY